MSQNQPPSRPDVCKEVAASLHANCRTTARQKCVSFNPYDNIQEILSRKNYTPQELRASWYDTIHVSCMRRTDGKKISSDEKVDLVPLPFGKPQDMAGLKEAADFIKKLLDMEEQATGRNEELEARQKKAEEDNTLSFPSEKSDPNEKKISVERSVDDDIVYGSDKVDGENFGIHRYQKSMKYSIWSTDNCCDEKEILSIYNLFVVDWGVRFLKKSKGTKEYVELSELEAKEKIRDDAREYWLAKQELSRDYRKTIVADGQRLWTEFMNDDFFNVTTPRHTKSLQFLSGTRCPETRNVQLPQQLEGARREHPNEFSKKYPNDTVCPDQSEHLSQQLSASNASGDDTENCVSKYEPSEVDPLKEKAFEAIGREIARSGQFAEKQCQRRRQDFLSVHVDIDCTKLQLIVWSKYRKRLREEIPTTSLTSRASEMGILVPPGTTLQKAKAVIAELRNKLKQLRSNSRQLRREYLLDQANLGEDMADVKKALSELYRMDRKNAQMSTCEASSDKSLTDISFIGTSAHSTLSTGEVRSLVAQNLSLNRNASRVVRERDIPENDIKLGRGRTLNHHPGNVWFQRLHDEHYDEYDALNKRKKRKTEYSYKILRIVGSEFRRFWKRCDDDKNPWEKNLWEEVGGYTEKARLKSCYTFRTIRRKRKKNDALFGKATSLKDRPGSKSLRKLLDQYLNEDDRADTQAKTN